MTARVGRLIPGDYTGVAIKTLLCFTSTVGKVYATTGAFAVYMGYRHVMLVQSPPSSAFSEFLSVNGAFWNRHERYEGASEKYVIVDLLHNNATVLLTNLHIAAYLARCLGSKIAGAVAPTFTAHMVPEQEVIALARSFGIERIFQLCAPTPVNFSKSDRTNRRRLFGWFSDPSGTASLARRLRGLQGPELRKAVLALRVKDVMVGDLIYDTYVNWTGRPTVLAFDEELEQAIEQAGRYATAVDAIFSSHKISAVVLSAPVYVDYGILLRLGLKHGVPIYCKAWLDPITLKKYRDMSESKEFPDSPIEPAMAFFRETLGSEFASLASEFFPPRSSTVHGLPDLRFGYSNKSEMSAKALGSLLGVDASKRTCLILSHHFRDCPHCYPDALFDDYYQWLNSVLGFAAKNPHLTWLVRQHPYELLLGETKNFNELVSIFKDHAHIKIVPDGIATSSFFELADGVTTVAGSGGLEFASAGVPPILAGNPFYGNLSFAIRPKTQREYFEQLAAIPTVKRLSAGQIQEAKEAALVHLSLKRIRCARIPFTVDLADQAVTRDTINAYWDMATKLATKPIAEDSLFINLKAMIEGKHHTIMDFELDRRRGNDR